VCLEPILCGSVSCGPRLFVFGLSSCVICSRQVSSTLLFVPMSAESYRCLGAPALTLLQDLKDWEVQAGRPGLFWTALVSGAKPGARLCVSCRPGAYDATRASGQIPMLARPSAEMVWNCIVSRAWVLCSASLALLHAVCVRLPVVMSLASASCLPWLPVILYSH
jgi:hypothetical protein